MDYKEFSLKEAKFIAGKGELCFREVLEDFEKAEYIDILTFNISSKNDLLINALRKAGKMNIPIRVITNIPNRWENYFKDCFRNTAKKTIDIYIKKLNPQNIGNLTSVLFKFDNHGKIIMTNNIIYWGSANYSDETKKNYECGTISRDRELIAFVHNEIFPTIIQESINYYRRDYVPYIASIFSAISFLHNIYDEIYDASYDIRQDYDTGFEDVRYFNKFDNHISWKLLVLLMETVAEFEGLLDGIKEEIENDDQEQCLDMFINSFKISIEHENENISRLCYELKELSQYDVEASSNDILSDKYGRVAYDEDLDYYAQLAFEKAIGMKQDLISHSEENVIELLKSIEKYKDALRIFADSLVKLSRINNNIDNTSYKRMV